MYKDEGGSSRVTTLIRGLLTQSASMSLRQDSSLYNVRHSVAAYLEKPLGAKLRDVFHICFPRTSHQPVAFCLFHTHVLVPITACNCFN